MYRPTKIWQCSQWLVKLDQGQKVRSRRSSQDGWVANCSYCLDQLIWGCSKHFLCIFQKYNIATLQQWHIMQHGTTSPDDVTCISALTDLSASNMYNINNILHNATTSKSMNPPSQDRNPKVHYNIYSTSNVLHHGTTVAWGHTYSQLQNLQHLHHIAS